MLRSHLRRSAALAALVLAAAPFGCGDDEPATAPAVAFVVIEPPATSTLSIGDTLRLRAVAADEEGRPVASASIGWTALDPEVALVDVTGLVTAVDGGTGRIAAESGEHADTVALTVISVPKSVAAGDTRTSNPPSRGR